MHDDRFWKKIVDLMKQDDAFSTSEEEIDALLESAPNVSLSKDKIEEIIDRVVSGKNPPDFLPVFDDDFLIQETNARVDEDMLVLNRNKGDDDPEAAARLEEMRRRLLEDEDADD